MPSRLGTLGARYFDPRKGGPVRRARGEALQARVDLSTTEFGGYTPDINPDEAQLGDAADCTNLVVRKGKLTQDMGFAQVDTARLPLGTATPPAAGGSEEPVVGIVGFTELSGARRELAITSGAPGHVYELASGVWTNRAYDTTPGPSAAIQGSSADHIGWAYFPPDDRLVFCNGANDPVYQWPVTGGAANEYSDFNQTAFGRTVHPSFTTFKARSVVSAEDRLLFLNTVETATAFQTRVRWTTKGGNASLTGTGSGFDDLNELSKGLRIMRLGDNVICYCDDGVALLQRTLLATDAFRRSYVSRERGLVGSEAVVDIGSGVHFGIFTDGWFIIDHTGRWREVGVRGPAPKWRNTFYDSLNADNIERVACYFDAINRFVRISFPSGEASDPDSVWIYDVARDIVFPHTYGDDTPNIWGGIDLASSITTWAASGGTWAATTGSWRSFVASTKPEMPTLGTVGGNVYRMDPALTNRDGSGYNYTYDSHLSANGNPALVKKTDALHVSFERLAGSPTAITGGLFSNHASSTADIPQDKGSAGDTETNSYFAQLAGNRVGYSLAGAVPVRISQITLSLRQAGGGPVRDETT